MMSVIAATVAIPAVAARDPRPRRGASRMMLWLVLFNSLYLAYVAIVHVGWHAP